MWLEINIFFYIHHSFFMKSSKILAVFMLLATSFSAFAQYEKGTKDLNVGIGLLPTFYASTYKAGLPLIGASFEVGLNDKISLGGYAGYSTSSYSIASPYVTTGGTVSNYNYTYNLSYLIIGPRVGYHFHLLDKADTYAGAMLGYNVATVSFTTDAPTSAALPTATASAGGLAYAIYAGIRYPFTPRIGAFAEIGYGVSVLQLGLNAKF